MKLFERLPLSVRTIQQTLLIAFAGNLIEAEPLAILYPTVPGMLAKIVLVALDYLDSGTYLDPTLGMPMLKSSILKMLFKSGF